MSEVYSQAISDLTNTFALLKQKMGHDLHVWLLPTKVDRRMRLARDILDALDEAFRGRMLDPIHVEAGHTEMKRLWELPKDKREPEPFEFDGVLTFSKEHLVGFSGTAHEADQPPHLKVLDSDVCSTTCFSSAPVKMRQALG